MNLTAARKRATLALVANFLDRMGDALDHIEDELTYTDANVWPAQTSLAASSYTDAKGQVVTVGSAGGGRGTPSSTVERRVIDAQDRFRAHQQNLWDAFTTLVAIAHDGSHQATAASKRYMPGQEHLRCNGGHGQKLEGHKFWRHQEPVTDPDGNVTHVDADCMNWPGQHPVIEGMCDDCTDHMNDWRTLNGFERIVRDTHALNYRHNTRGERGRFSAA